jgi:PII-like signaling protein
MTIWTDFVKVWAAEHKVSYGCALSDPKIKTDYRMKHPEKPKTKKAAKALAEKQGAAASDLMAMATKAKDEPEKPSRDEVTLDGKNYTRDKKTNKVYVGEGKKSIGKMVGNKFVFDGKEVGLTTTLLRAIYEWFDEGNYNIKNTEKYFNPPPLVVEALTAAEKVFKNLKSNYGLINNILFDDELKNTNKDTLIADKASKEPVKESENKKKIKEWFNKLINDPALLKDKQLEFDTGFGEVMVTYQTKYKTKNNIVVKEIYDYLEKQTKKFTKGDIYDELGSDARYLIDYMLTKNTIAVTDNKTGKWRTISLPKLNYPLYSK